MIKFYCKCGQKIGVQDKDAGKRARCPRCKRIVRIPDANAPSHDATDSQRGGGTEELDAVLEDMLRKESEASRDKVEKPPAPAEYTMADEPEPTKQCPYCAEQILLDTTKCEHCGEWLNTDVQAQPSGPPPVDAIRAIGAKGVKATNGLGIASLVLGIIAALTCWIPFIGILGVPLAILGLLFGVIGFLIAVIGGRSGVGMPVSGSIVCIVAVIIAVLSTGGAVTVVDQAIRQAESSYQRDLTDETETSVPPDSSMQEVNKAELIQAQKKAYMPYVTLRNVHTGKTVLGEQGVFGEIKNNGDRTLKEVQITVYCLDTDSKPISEEKFHPVMDVKSSFSLRDHMPLRPNYAQKFGYELDTTSDWSGKIYVEMTNVEFADDDAETFPVSRDLEMRAYLPNIALVNVRKGKSVLEETGVFGEIKNMGDRTLTKLEVMIYCLDKGGHPIFEKRYYPILLSDSSYLTDKNKPLKPNYSQSFGCKMDDAPSEWSGEVEIAVIDMKFGE